MAVPRGKEARLFYRYAKQRLGEARVLQEAFMPTGAVYLAGYSVECILKALIFSVVPLVQIEAVLGSFRGVRVHDYNWLRDQYRLRGGASFPGQVNRDFTLVNIWSTNLRYELAAFREPEAEEFLKSVGRIIEWAEGRI